MRPPLELALGFVAIEVSLWHCIELLPKVSPVFVRAGAIVGDLSHVRQPSRGLSGNAPPREFSLGFVAIEVSLWHCTELVLEISPVLIHIKAIGEISPTYASLPEVSLGMRPSLEFSLKFIAIEVSLWHCIELLPEISSVLDRAEAIIGEIPNTLAFQSFSGNSSPP